MKTRTFKNPGMKNMYNLFRTGNHSTYYGTAAGSAYKLGLDGYPDPGVPTSLAHAAWAAGADELHDIENANPPSLFKQRFTGSEYEVMQ